MISYIIIIYHDVSKYQAYFYINYTQVKFI